MRVVWRLIRKENEELRTKLSKKQVASKESLIKNIDFLKMKNSGTNPCETLSKMHFTDYFED